MRRLRSQVKEYKERETGKHGRPTPTPPAAPPGSDDGTVDESSVAADEEERVDIIEDRLLLMERELLRIRAAQRRLGRENEELRRTRSGSASPAEPQDELVLALRRENEDLRAALEALKARQRSVAADAGALRRVLKGGSKKESSDSTAAGGDADRLRRELDRYQNENKALESDLQSLRGLYDEKVRRFEEIERSPTVAGADDALADVPEAARSLVKNAATAARKAQIERDALVADLETERKYREKTSRELEKKLTRLQRDHDSLVKQRGNLQRLLEQRDMKIESGVHELTAEEITSSKVFKDMVANMNETVRMEITHLHDAVSDLASADPAAYNVVLDAIARHFAAAEVENPLDKLPKVGE